MNGNYILVDYHSNIQTKGLMGFSKGSKDVKIPSHLSALCEGPPKERSLGLFREKNCLFHDVSKATYFFAILFPPKQSLSCIAVTNWPLLLFSV
jgi:hypothetical protein